MVIVRACRSKTIPEQGLLPSFFPCSLRHHAVATLYKPRWAYRGPSIESWRSGFRLPVNVFRACVRIGEFGVRVGRPILWDVSAKPILSILDHGN